MRSRRIPMPRLPRHTIRIPAQIVRLHDFRLLSDSLENLSEGGALVATRGAATPGEKLIVSFRVPKTEMWLDLDAVVARYVQGRRSGDRGPQIGLRFEGLSEASEGWIRALLKIAPPAAPGTRPGRRQKADAVRELVIGSGWTYSRLGQMLVRWWDK